MIANQGKNKTIVITQYNSTIFSKVKLSLRTLLVELKEILVIVVKGLAQRGPELLRIVSEFVLAPKVVIYAGTEAET